jgi:hypothetical protein
MFPERVEATDVIEDPEQLRDDQRAGLMDYTPVQSTLFAHEEARRNTYAKDRLNLRDGGARTTTDPWQNEGYDTQFHDADPRGASIEQPWSEYRRMAEAQYRKLDYKDDGDYSVTERGIRPEDMYKNIRGAQSWVKARLKVFETSLEGRHSGGVGNYDKVSQVFKSDQEDSSVLVDGTRMSQTFEDPEVRRRSTITLSNVVHNGSRALQANTTTDHKVKVASYGKLYAQKGLIPHESQLRIVDDDTPRSRMEGTHTTPRNLVKLMSGYVHGPRDEADPADPSIYDAGNFGNMRQQRQMEGEKEKFTGGMRGNSETRTNTNNTVTRDIMALLGFVEQDIRYLRQLERSNAQQAMPMIANLYNLAETVHSLPANAKLELRNELLLKSAGGGLLPGPTGAVGRAVVVNPKLIKFMDNQVRSIRNPIDNDEQGNRREGEAEAAKYRALLAGEQRVTKQMALGDQLNNTRAGEAQIKPGSEHKTHSYASLAKYAQRPDLVPHIVAASQLLNDTSVAARYGRNMAIGQVDLYGQRSTTAQDVDWHDTAGMVRHSAAPGSRSTSRAHVRTDYASPDAMNDLTVGNSDRPSFVD